MLKNDQQLITYRPYIAALLRRLQTARSLVGIKINKEPDLFNSIVLEIDPGNAFFYLDVVASANGHQKIQPGTQLHLDSRLDGVKINFDTCVMHAADSVAVPGYKIACPAKLLYKQRRRHFRARIEATETLPISLPQVAQQPVEGYLVDISASGVCSRVDYPHANRLQAEQAFHAAKVTLPDKQAMTCDMALRSVRHFPDHGYSLIGVEFMHISAHQQHHLERMVALLDRVQRRSNELPGPHL